MEIRGTHGGAVERTDVRHTAANDSRKTPGSESRDPGTGIHTKSKELLRLAEDLQRLPEVRDSEVQRVSKTLADGGYDTPEAVLKTADAMLRSQ